MKVHELQTDAEAWHGTDDGSKTAEVRFNDRDYAERDLLILRCECGGGHEPLVAQVTGVFQGGRYGIEPGYVLLSHRVIRTNRE